MSERTIHQPGQPVEVVYDVLCKDCGDNNVVTVAVSIHWTLSQPSTPPRLIKERTLPEGWAEDANGIYCEECAE